MMDYRELKEHVDAFTVDAAKLREWCQQGVNVALLDLRRAYLQVRVHKSFWACQMVLIKGGEILPYAVGLRVKCGADDHEDYRQYSVGTRGMDDEGNDIQHQ